ncbi:MAG: PucR family transcriptional regulator [Traorella sp.]
MNQATIKNLLKKYQSYYHAQFKFIYNQEIIYDELHDNQKIYTYPIQIQEKEGFLLSNKQIPFDLIQITLEEILSVDKQSLFKQMLSNEYNDTDIEYLQNEIKTDEYTILIIQTNKACEDLYSMVSNILTAICYEIEKNTQVVVLYPHKIEKEIIMQLKDTLETELYCKVYLSYSSVFNELNDIPQKYQEARDLLNIYMKYDFNNLINNNSNVLLAYVVENINEEKLSILSQHLNIESFYSLDDEFLNTINVFYHNNLNIAETARKMYIHRNTLIYRIEKIKAVTGFDIRNFDEAIQVQFAMLLMKK